MPNVDQYPPTGMGTAVERVADHIAKIASGCLSVKHAKSAATT
jgi:hypothetical protein